MVCHAYLAVTTYIDIKNYQYAIAFNLIGLLAYAVAIIMACEVFYEPEPLRTPLIEMTEE